MRLAYDFDPNIGQGWFLFLEGGFCVRDNLSIEYVAELLSQDYPWRQHIGHIEPAPKELGRHLREVRYGC